MKSNLILASKSPRRQELLRKIYKDEFVICNSKFDETKLKNTITDPVKLTELLAINKALAVSNENKDYFVLGSDTVVEIDGEILGKPQNAENTRVMLRKLFNKTHHVMTSYAIVKNNEVLFSETVVSDLFIHKMSDEELEAYIKTGSPFDKAGGYGVQDVDFIKTDKVNEEDFHNIMGFPIEHIKIALKKLQII